MTRLGRTEVQVTPLCFGGNIFGWTADERASFAVLDAYVEAGGNFIDTADVYSAWVLGHTGGESETVLGKWMHTRKNRAQIVLATKVGLLNNKGGEPDLSRAQILQAVDHSLQRLQTDYIDLYFAHRDDSATPLEETLSTFAELVKAGKVRVLGASNYSAARMVEAFQISQEHGYPRYEVQQPLYNLLDRDAYEGDLADFCVKHEISVVPYSSLASGFLTGKYRRDTELPASKRAGGIKQRYWNERNFTMLNHLLQIASQYGAAPAQVALAWLLTRPGVTAPIASATTVEQTRELMGALNLHLDQDALDLLNEVPARV
jgi:aryl-alcohol dehydrogenase-like predicted oxidoreductase